MAVEATLGITGLARLDFEGKLENQRKGKYESRSNIFRLEEDDLDRTNLERPVRPIPAF